MKAATVTAKETVCRPRVLSRPEHCLSRKKLSENAIKVLYRLHRSGYLAYLVGGGVRDLLLGMQPKDFDVATNARPQEIRRLFRNSRIIGRRFRLVHVFFRGEIVEVSTFRASPDPDDWEEGEDEREEHESAHEDPPRGATETVVYGTPEEDAGRRDLTINGLFYNIADFSIIDWVGGLSDLGERTIRIIGDPDQRFAEDPVRMMRALEYRTRLGFDVHPETEAAIRHNADLIRDASPARLTYELMECLRSGNAAGIWTAWRDFGILERVFPELTDSDRSLGEILQGIDTQANGKRGLGDASILAALFLPRFVSLLEEMGEGGRKINNPLFLEKLAEILDPASRRMLASNHTMYLMSQGLFALTKMRRPPERGRQVVKLARHECFPVAWDLFSLGTSIGLLPRSSFEAWDRVVRQVRQAPPGEEPEVTIDANRRTRRRRRPRRRGRSRS